MNETPAVKIIPYLLGIIVGIIIAGLLLAVLLGVLKDGNSAEDAFNSHLEALDADDISQAIEYLADDCDKSLDERVLGEFRDYWEKKGIKFLEAFRVRETMTGEKYTVLLVQNTYRGGKIIWQLFEKTDEGWKMRCTSDVVFE